jgi:predicted phage tail component-like protein
MTIRDSLYFIYNGVTSTDMNIINVNMDSGMQEEYFASSRSINEEKTRGRSKPYFQGTEKEPIMLSVSFAFEDAWDDDLLRRVRVWLTEQDYYKPLIFSNDLEKVYYAICVDDTQLVHNSLQQGYIKLNFRCNDAYAYSPLTLSQQYDWNEIPMLVKQGDFSIGGLHGVVLNESNHLTLSSTLKKWSDFPPNTKWKDLL